MWRAAIGAAALLALAGCDDGEVEVDAGGRVDAGDASGRAPCAADAGEPPPDPSGLTNECADALVLSGFGLRFDDGARTLGRFGVYPRVGVDVTGCAASAGLRQAALVAELAGGEGDASGLVRASYFTVGLGMDRDPVDGGAPPLGVHAIRGVVALRMDGPEVVAPRLVDLRGGPLDGVPAVAVVIDGVELDTDQPQGPSFPSSVDPAAGYPLARLGVSIGEPTLTDGELTFDVTGRYAGGRTGDTANDAAVEMAVVELQVRYAIVGLPRPAVTAPIAYREQHQPHGDAEASVCRPAAETGRLTVSAAPAAHALAALRSFDLRLFPEEDAGEGVRVRELGVRILEHDFDPGTGEATMRVEGYVSNEGAPPPRREVDYAFEAEVAHLSWDGPGDVVSLSVTAPLTAGRAEHTLPLGD